MEDEDALAARVATKIAATGLFQPAKKRKPRTNWEAKLLTEYMVTRYPTWLSWRRVEVGPIRGGKDAKYFKKLRRWADAIITDMKQVIIIEAKMRPDHGAIAQVQTYMELFPETPEFTQLRDLPVYGLLLTTAPDEAVQTVAQKWGVGYDVFVPSFMDEYNQVIIERGYKGNAPYG